MGVSTSEHHGALIVDGNELEPVQMVDGTDDHDRLVADANTFIQWKDGTTEISKITVDDLDNIKQNAEWAIGAGYSLVQNGSIVVTQGNVTVGNDWYYPSSIEPRTMFGVNSSGNYISVVIDGRNAGGSRGANAYEQAQIMYELGAVNAINFDGGGSSTFWHEGSVKNVPSDGSERSIGSVMMVVLK